MLSAEANRHEGYKSEQRHAATRAAVIGCICAYILAQTYRGYPLPSGLFIACVVTVHFITSCGLLLWIRRRPGESHPRHYVMTILDISGMTYMMAVGGAPFLLLY